MEKEIPLDAAQYISGIESTREILSVSEKGHWFDRMVRFQPQLGVSARRWANFFEHCLIELPTIWFDVECHLNEDYCDKYIATYGEWGHTRPRRDGGVAEHDRLGMAYAWWVKHVAHNLVDFSLRDSPDFIGFIPNDLHDNEHSIILGDIGRCSPLALFETLRRMRGHHDVWVSVLDWNRQIFVQFGYSPSPYVLSRTLDAFYCPQCAEWSISGESQKLLKWASI